MVEYDSNKALQRIRELLRIINATYDLEFLPSARELVKEVKELDTQLSTGAAFPESWSVVDVGHRKLCRDSVEFRETYAVASCLDPHCACHKP